MLSQFWQRDCAEGTTVVYADMYLVLKNGFKLQELSRFFEPGMIAYLIQGPRSWKKPSLTEIVCCPLPCSNGVSQHLRMSKVANWECSWETGQSSHYNISSAERASSNGRSNICMLNLWVWVTAGCLMRFSETLRLPCSLVCQTFKSLA